MIRVIHKECGKVAFYFKKRVKIGEMVYISNVVLLDGSQPVEYEPIICGSCKKQFSFGTDTVKQEHWTDWFIVPAWRNR